MTDADAEPACTGTGRAARRPQVPGRRARIARALASATEPMTVEHLAGTLGMPPTTVRFHLSALVRAGVAEQVAGEPSGPGRPPLRFRSVAGLDPTGPRDFRLLARLLACGLAGLPDGPERALSAGEAEGRSLARTHGVRPRPDRAEAIGALAGVLAELGFPGHPADRGDRLELHGCPFLEVAHDRSEIVCPVHLGLMRGLLDAWDAPVTVSDLDAFAAPGTCIAHLAPARTDTPSSSSSSSSSSTGPGPGIR